MNFIVLYMAQYQFKYKYHISLWGGVTEITQFVFCGLSFKGASSWSETNSRLNEEGWKEEEKIRQPGAGWGSPRGIGASAKPSQIPKGPVLWFEVCMHLLGPDGYWVPPPLKQGTHVQCPGRGLGPRESSQVAPCFHGPTAPTHGRWETPQDLKPLCQDVLSTWLRGWEACPVLAQTSLTRSGTGSSHVWPRDTRVCAWSPPYQSSWPGPFPGKEWQQSPAGGVRGDWLRSGTGEWVAKNPSQGGPSQGGGIVQELEV